MTKIVKIKQDFNEIFGENIMILKKIKTKALHSLQSIYFLKYVLGVKVWIFLNESSILVFAEISNLSFHLNKNELR